MVLLDLDPVGCSGEAKDIEEGSGGFFHIWWRRPGVQATDLVLALTEYLRGQNVLGAVLEFFGPEAAPPSLANRATISDMAPEFGAISALFAIDGKTPSSSA